MPGQAYTEDDLLPGQSRCIDLLMTETSISNVASKLNVTRQTIWTWLHKDVRFKFFLAEVEARTLATAARKLVSLCVKATETLDAAMEGDDVTPAQLRSADIVLKRAPILLESAMVHVRLADLERKLAKWAEHDGRKHKATA
jgi:hypothetical protein